MQFVACLLAALENDGQYGREELVEPLLLVVVRAVEELDEAHVVCLRRGEWVSGAASSARATPADRCAIVKRQTDFLRRRRYGLCSDPRAAWRPPDCILYVPKEGTILTHT